MIFIQDLNGNYIYYNGSSKYGLSQNDVIGKTFRDLHELKYARKFEERFQKICITGERIVEETELEWKGEKYWFHDSLYPIKENDGRIKSIATISHNITGLKNALIDIRQNEELFQNIFKSIPGLATLWHRNEQNKIILAVANEGSYLESKGKIRELIGIEVYDFFTNNPEPAKYITNTMNSGGSNNLVYKIKLRTTGKIKWFLCRFCKSQRKSGPKYSTGYN